MIKTATLLFAIALAAAAAEPAALVEQAANGWMQSAVKQDAAGLNKFMADDLQYAHAGGNTQNKEQYVKAVTTGPARYESFTLSDLKIRFYGPKAAVLTAYCDVKMVGQENFRVRTLQVYVENNGQWQMAAHQSTRMGR